MLMDIIFMLFFLTSALEQSQNQTYECECYKPVFILHGIRSSSDDLSVLETHVKEAHPGTTVHNSNAYPDDYSFTPLWDQINGDLGKEFKIFSDKYSCGIVLIGHSQGALLARALVETYPEHNVHVLILISGPVGGQFGVPDVFGVLDPLFVIYFSLPDSSVFLYNSVAQTSFSISNYWRDPDSLDMYFNTCDFLPYIDNEKPSNQSPNYKTAFKKLEKLVAIGGPDDEVIIPWESSFFSFYGTNNTVVINFKDRTIYTENLFGLRTLDEKGCYIRHEREGIKHMEWIVDPDVFEDFILPHLASNPSPCKND